MLAKVTYRPPHAKSLRKLQCTHYLILVHTPPVLMVWPAPLLHLTLGKSVNRLTLSVEFPASVEHLTVGCDFNQPHRLAGRTRYYLTFGESCLNPIARRRRCTWNVTLPSETHPGGSSSIRRVKHRVFTIGAVST